MALPLLFPGAAVSDSLIEEAIVSYLRSLSDYDAHSVIDHEPRAYVRSGMDFNPGEQPRDMGEKSGQDRYPCVPEHVIYAVKKNGVKTRVREKDLESTSRGGIAFENRPVIPRYLFPEAHESDCSLV
jgi:hypothetical protein